MCWFWDEMEEVLKDGRGRRREKVKEKTGKEAEEQKGQ